MRSLTFAIALALATSLLAACSGQPPSPQTVPPVPVALGGSLPTRAPRPSPSASPSMAPRTGPGLPTAQPQRSMSPAPSASPSPTGQFAGSLFIFSGSVFNVVAATSGQTKVNIPSPVGFEPFAASTGTTVLLNAFGNANLSIFDLTTGTITHTIATGCTSSDNVPIAAANGAVYYDCGGTVYEYNAAGAVQATWSDREGSGSSGYIAAGGNFVYTINGKTVYVFDSAGHLLRNFTVANFPSPRWAFAAAPQGLFIANGSSVSLYSPIGGRTTSFAIGAPVCGLEPVGNSLTVRTGPNIFTTYNVTTGLPLGSITTAVTSDDCRVGFSN